MAHVVDTYELSPLQSGMLFHVLSGGDPGVNIQQAVATLHEPLDEAQFLRAWQRVVERHPVLRSRFRWEGVAEPLQEVIDRVQIPVERFDWRALTEAGRRERFESLLDQDRARGFDLGQAPLMRLALVRAGEREHWVLWTYHHGVLDGRSRLLLLREVFAFYEASSRGEDADLPLPRPYREHIEWLRKLDHAAAEPYWQGVLSGFRAPTPLVVAQDREAEHVAARVRGAHEVRLSAALTTALKERARNASVTLNNVVQGAWALLLYRYGGEPDIVFGATRACRKSALGGADDMIGLFINTLPMRVRVDPEAELAPWLRQLRDQQVALRDYEHTSLVMVKSWSEVPAGTPLFESILVFENRTQDVQLRALGGTWSERRFLNRGEAGFPLVLNAWGDDELLLQLDYSRRRFDDAVVARMLGHLQTLLEGMAARPQARLRDLPLLTGAERRQLLVEWNDTAVPYPKEKLLHQLFEAQVQRTPEAVALVYEGERLSYGELNARANRLAHYLRDQGVGPEVLVGVCVERSLEMVVGLLGILKAGGAYVPLDPGYPKERLAYMLADARPRVLLTQERLLASLPDYAGAVFCLDRDWGELGDRSEANPANRTRPHELAYVIYTSGSTGRPKGVMAEHRAMVNRLAWLPKRYPISPDSLAIQKTALSFIDSITETLAPLFDGASLFVASTKDTQDIDRLLKFCLETRITRIVAVPSLVRSMLELDRSRIKLFFENLELFISSGEALLPHHVASLKPLCPLLEILNLYGSSEVAGDVTYFSCKPDELDRLSIPIGRPIANTQLYILDAYLNPVPVGVPGELHIGGDGLARGYLNRPDLTAEKFIANPFSAEPGARLYKTGDLARYLPDGNVEYLGRLDHQVKLRGFRIELGEIEAVLSEHEAVAQAVVLAREDAPGEKRLVAYVVAAVGRELSIGSLRGWLQRKLPEYMIPSAFVVLDELPLTPNGKLDRKGLPAPDTARSEVGYVAPRTPMEEKLAAIWAEVLKVERVGIHDNFFDLGGHSLLAFQITSRVRDAFQVALSLRDIFVERPTVAGLAAQIAEARANKVAPKEMSDGLTEPEWFSDEKAQRLLAQQSDSLA